LIVALALAAWRIHRIGRPPNRLLAVLTVTLVFWGLTALNANPLAPPDTGRYVYMAAIFVVMVTAELARGVRAGPWVVAAVLAAAALAAFSNLYQLHKHAAELADITQLERAGLGALELTRDTVDPNFKLDPQNSNVDYLLDVDAGSYLSAVDAYGSPADSPEQLAAAPEGAKVAADKVFAGALGISLRPVAPTQGPCRTERRSSATPPTHFRSRWAISRPDAPSSCGSPPTGPNSGGHCS
jgi:hypothetical protein